MRNSASGSLCSGLLWPGLLWSVFLLTLLAAAMPVAAQLRAGAVYTSSDAGSDTPFPRLRVVVAPPDLRTPPLAADLNLVEDGKDQKQAVDVRSFEATGYPLAAAVLIDVSGSMAGRPLALVRSSLTKFVDDARPEDKIADLTVADDARWDAPFGTDRSTVKQLLAGVAPRGRLTRLYDGILQAIGGFAPSLPQRRELIVISDGHDEGSRAPFSQVVEAAKSRGIAIDAIGLTRSEPRYLKTLADMAAQTGGSYRHAESDAELQAFIQNGIASLKATPVAAFDLEKITPDGKRHQLAVRWKKGGVLSNTVAFTAPAQAAHPILYFLQHLPLWAWVAAAGFLLLAASGIVFAVIVSKRKHVPAPALAPAPEALSAPTPHAPTQEIRLAGAHATVSDFRPQAAKPQPAPDSQASAARRVTQLGGIFVDRDSVLARLEGESGLVAGRSFAVTREAVEKGFWIGATQGCAVELSDDPMASGYHAYLAYEEPILILADNNSTNGTRLNGELLRGQRHPLKPGDRIQIGRSLFRVVV